MLRPETEHTSERNRQVDLTGGLPPRLMPADRRIILGDRRSEPNHAATLPGIGNSRWEGGLSSPELPQGRPEDLFTLGVRKTIVHRSKEDAEQDRHKTGAEKPPPGIARNFGVYMHTCAPYESKLTPS